jgi:hypothetical protein
MAMASRRRMLDTCQRVQHRCLDIPGTEDDPEQERSKMMVHSAHRSVVSRLLSAAAVLTLVGFAAIADLQPASALAFSAERADVVVGASYLEDDNDGNHDDNENRDEDRNNDDNDNRDDKNHNRNNGNNGGQGIFSLICSVPGFANNAGCASGLLGN